MVSVDLRDERGVTDELARISALHNLGVLDTPPEPVFDDMAWMASHICETPIALVSLIDRDRQWFKACVGLDVTETPREYAFCAHAIGDTKIMEVHDALQDPRFAANPLVLGEPRIRFYAGAPLIGDDGHALGTLCVIDTQPRSLTAQQREALARLAVQTAAQLHQRQALAATLDREQALRRMLETMPDGVVCCNAQGVISRFNQVAREWFGFDPGSTPMVEWDRDIGCYHADGQRPIAPEDLPLVRAWRGEDVRNAEFVLKRPGQQARVLSCNARPLTTHAGQPAGAVLVMHDITQAKQASARLAESEGRWRATLESIGDAVVTADEGGGVTFMNPAAERMFGSTLSDVAGRPMQSLWQAAGSTDTPATALLELVLAGRVDESPTTGQELERRDGARVTLEISGATVSQEGRSVAGAVLVFRDVSEARELERRIDYQAVHDALTGIPNRTEFERQLEEELALARADDKGGGLLFVDLDQFKLINDSCGYAAGDELLKQVARQLEAQLRETDLVARFGADEFVVLLRQCPVEAAMNIADRMCKAVSQMQFAWSQRTYAISASIGLVPVCPGDAAATLTIAADAACQVAKEKGGNRVYLDLAADSNIAHRQGELDWVPRLREAMLNDRFVLYGQQIAPVTHDPGAVPHFEVLLRLRDEDGALVPPMKFIPVAERYGVMPDIDRWVLRNALRRLATSEVDKATVLSINLSGRTLGDDSFPAFVEAVFCETGVPYSRVCLEITETAAIANLMNAEGFINWFRAQGGQFSLDDFGSGMSSFGYLKRLRVDFLKIDGAFVRNLTNDSVDEAMVQAIHGVGSLMGLRTVAEFVDGPETLERLRAMGVHYAQGYGVHVPQRLEELL